MSSHDHGADGRCLSRASLYRAVIAAFRKAPRAANETRNDLMITRHISGSIHHRIVEHGDTVYIGGLVADDKTKDMKGQAEEIFAKLDKLLETAGTSKKKLLQVMVYSSDFNQKDGFNAAWKDWLAPEDMPVRAYLGVSDLSPNTLVEVVTIAAK